MASITITIQTANGAPKNGHDAVPTPDPITLT